VAPRGTCPGIANCLRRFLPRNAASIAGVLFIRVGKPSVSPMKSDRHCRCASAAKASSGRCRDRSAENREVCHARPVSCCDHMGSRHSHAARSAGGLRARRQACSCLAGGRGLRLVGEREFARPAGILRRIDGAGSALVQSRAASRQHTLRKEGFTVIDTDLEKIVDKLHKLRALHRARERVRQLERELNGEPPRSADLPHVPEFLAQRAPLRLL
jgi:hypothetical protein